MATFPIIVDIIGANEFHKKSKELASSLRRAMRANRIIQYKIKKLKPYLIRRLLLKLQYQQFTPPSEISHITKEIERIDNKIEALGLGIWGRLSTSVAFWMLLSILILQVIFLKTFDGFIELKWWSTAILLFITCLMVPMASAMLIPSMIVKIIRVQLAISNKVTVKIGIPVFNFLASNKYGRAFARASYGLFLLGFIIKMYFS